MSMLPDPFLPNPSGANQPPAVLIKPSPRMSAMRIAFGVIAILISLLLGLLVLLLIGFENGPVALLVGLVTALFPYHST